MVTQDEFEAHFERLRAHLVEVQPIFESFCLAYGYEFAPRLSIGRYPRIRIRKEDFLIRWFDFSMGLDSDGKRFETFCSDRPHEFGCGAFVDFDLGTPYARRFGKTMLIFEDRPFHKVAATLMAEMKQFESVMRFWTLETLVNEGHMRQLGQ